MTGEHSTEDRDGSTDAAARRPTDRQLSAILAAFEQRPDGRLTGPAEDRPAVGGPGEEPLADDPVMQTVHVIAELHARDERQIDPHQRRVEAATALLGRPAALYLVVSLTAAWVIVNLVAPRPFRFDPAPFQTLQMVMSFAAMATALVVLITQNRLDKLAERRAQLDLQVSLLAEQKVTKLISLIEELRRDSPNLRDRLDAEAEAMSEPADPAAILVALETKLGENREDLEELEAALAEADTPAEREAALVSDTPADGEDSQHPPAAGV